MILKLQVTSLVWFLFSWHSNIFARPSIKNPHQVIITANLKGTGFSAVPVDILIPDFLDKKPQEFDFILYDSTTGNFKAIFTLTEPRLMLFFLKEVYVTPGDSINLKYIVLENTDKIYKDTVIVSGSNKTNYQYYTIFRNEYMGLSKNFPTSTLPYTKNKIIKYRDDLTVYYNKIKEQFVLSLKGSQYTNSYKKYVLNDLYNYWANNYLDRLSTADIYNLSPNEREQIKQKLIANADTGSYAFLSALLKLHRMSMNGIEKTYNLKEYQALQRDALKYPPHLKDYLLTADIIDFVKNKRGINNELMLALNTSYKLINSPKYKQKLFYYKQSLADTIEKISIKLDTIQLVDLNNNLTTLGKVISNNINNIVYIDFWASWCIPCRKEMQPLKNLYVANENKKIKYIQISLDTDSNRWKKAVISDGIKFSENYRFINLEDSRKFDNELNYMVIPYYLLIDINGNIELRNAPRPSDPKLKLLLDKAIAN